MDFRGVTIGFFQFNSARRLAGFGDDQRIGAASRVEIEGRPLAVQSVAHAESQREQPAALGVNDRAGGEAVLGDDMVDGAGIANDALGKNSGGFAEEIIDKIGVVKVEVE